MPPPKLPDPKDRSPNQPFTVMDKKKALKCYNRDNGTSYVRVTPGVKSDLTAQFLEKGWTDVSFTQTKIVLKADVQLNPQVTTPQTSGDSNVVPFRVTAKAG